MGLDNYSLVAGDGSGDLLIGVTHAPYLRILDAMSEDNLDLIFAGHTHGGQVDLPLIGSPIGERRFGNRVYGHVVEDDRHMIISSGLGTSIVPVRLGRPPEIVVVDLGHPPRTV